MKKLSYLQRFGEIELAVRRRGSGIPFVWGHALMGSMRVEDQAALWDWQGVERYAEVVRYDARGHGNSDGSYNDRDYRWEHMASDMLAVADAVARDRGVGRCLLGGMSMGAATALEAAVQRPDRVAGLVLVLPPTAWDTRPRQAGIYRRMSWVSGLLGAAPYRLLDLLPVPVREDGRNQIALHTAKGLARANPLHVQAVLGGAARSDMASAEVLSAVHVPTLILAWEDDRAHPLSTVEALTAHLPDVREVVVCHPADIGEWQTALLGFVRTIAAEEQRRARPNSRRARSNAVRGRRRATA